MSTQKNTPDKRQQQMVLVVVVAIVAVIAVALIAISTLTSPAPLPPVSASGDGDTANTSDAENGEPAGGFSGSLYDGLERGQLDGMPALGSPDAPVVIHDYSAFSCGHCANFHDNQMVSLLEDVRAGEVRFVFVPVINEATAGATAAAFCAEEQGAFWEMHDLLFTGLRTVGMNAFLLEPLQANAEALGLDMDAFNECLFVETEEGAAFTDAILERLVAASELWQELVTEYTTADGVNEVTGTPTLTFNGEAIDWTGDGRRSGGVSYDDIRAQIDARL